jgi:hypothetical protein
MRSGSPSTPDGFERPTAAVTTPGALCVPATTVRCRPSGTPIPVVDLQWPQDREPHAVLPDRTSPSRARGELRWLMVIVAAANRGEAGADFVGFGGADGGVAGEGFLPVVPGLDRVVAGLIGAG